MAVYGGGPRRLRYTIKVPPNPQFLSAYRDLYPRSQKQFRIELQTKVKPALQKQVDKTFGSDPGPVKKPIDWTSVRQRAAFFASNGFNKGIPYKRTGQLRTSWVVVVSTQLRTNLITLRNPKPYADYVYPGPHQQQMHINTGWGKRFDQYYTDLERLEDIEIASAWQRAVNFAIKVKQ